MSVFVVVATKSASKVAAAIKAKGLPQFELKSDAWLVASDQTTRELAEKLGIRKGENGSGLVCAVEAYSGRLPTSAWEWLKLHSSP